MNSARPRVIAVGFILGGQVAAARNSHDAALYRDSPTERLGGKP